MSAYRPFDRVFEPAALTSIVVDLEEAKDHERIPSSRDDLAMQSFLTAAQDRVERISHRLLTARACVLRLMMTPGGSDPIELPGGIVASITSVTVDGVAVTGCTCYGDSPARLYPAAAWPVAIGTVYPVVVTYVAGYATIPQSLRVAIKMLAGEMNNRREVATEDAVHLAPFTADSLIELYRIESI